MNGETPIRKRIAALLIVVTAGLVAARIANAELLFEPSSPRKWPEVKPRAMPTFSSNDRSRWATVRALVDGDPKLGQPKGTYIIGYRDPKRKAILGSAVSPLAGTNVLAVASLAAAGYQTRAKSDQGIIFEDGWQSVDKVLHPNKLEFISSKPPLLSTLMAGLYWLLQLLTGWTLTDNPFPVVRILLLLVNWLPFLIYLMLFARLLERFGTTDWGRPYVLAGACFATFLTTFAITFNNHSIATYCVLFALYPTLRILESEQWSSSAPWGLFALAGLFASLAACSELPAAAFAVALFAILLRWSPKKTLLFFVPAAALPVAAFILTNFLAVGQFRLAYSEFGGPWYEYEGSHWRKPNPGEVKNGIDWAWTKESRWQYAFHVLFGHHGLFSLTPILVFAVCGMIRFTFADIRYWLSGPPRSPTLQVGQEQASPDSKSQATDKRRVQSLLAVLTLVLTVVVVGFYLNQYRPNYGGWTCGLRWLMWLSPLWLLCMAPVADHLAGCKWGRLLACLLLAISVFSANFAAANPWRHPWIYRLMEAMGWPGY
jgi:hypothetical protein